MNSSEWIVEKQVYHHHHHPSSSFIIININSHLYLSLIAANIWCCFDSEWIKKKQSSIASVCSEWIRKKLNIQLNWSWKLWHLKKVSFPYKKIYKTLKMRMISGWWLTNRNCDCKLLSNITCSCKKVTSAFKGIISILSYSWWG